jgi:hypothetical protein
MRKLIPLLTLVFAMPSLADGIYKWVDENGQVHYTDVPQESPDAVEVKVKPAQTFTMPSVASSSSSASKADASATPDGPVYKSLEITSPAMEETVWNTGGLVTVAVNVQPSLRRGHAANLYLDGKQVGTLSPGMTSLQLTDVERGAHSLSAEVVNEKSATVIESAAVTFFYQQTSVNRRPGG